MTSQEINNLTNLSTASILKRACEKSIVVPAFNIPYLPMVEPVIEAVVETNSFALIEVARLEWEKFESQSPEKVMEEYCKFEDPRHVRIHLDHVPVVDEDGNKVDYLGIMDNAIKLGYQSVMVDGSRLELDENIEATRKVVEIAHEAGIACEAELGAVLGHEDGPLPPYEELFSSGKGFTDIGDAKRFVGETGCDWLSVAIGNIHGNISKAKRDEKKMEARLDLEHLSKLHSTLNIPLVLHGGSGIKKEFVVLGIQKGITKINIGTEIRQAYEKGLKESGNVKKAQESLNMRAKEIISDYFEIQNSHDTLAN